MRLPLSHCRSPRASRNETLSSSPPSPLSPPSFIPFLFRSRFYLRLARLLSKRERENGERMRGIVNRWSAHRMNLKNLQLVWNRDLSWTGNKLISSSRVSTWIDLELFLALLVRRGRGWIRFGCGMTKIFDCN